MHLHLFWEDGGSIFFWLVLLYYTQVKNVPHAPEVSNDITRISTLILELNMLQELREIFFSHT